MNAAENRRRINQLRAEEDHGTTEARKRRRRKQSKALAGKGKR
jgi:hypothetical protein